ncbi:hypothetical protein Nepgr_013022 [Nepenthes gracilis]|uniref:Copper transport protein n=1 Tax=Nepenthes gracilis TaxID=150966 RepID=A0AAD3SI53_NEPGR|nr:hypothetical protein Nepgr_013022 [Nepenthes gracilis]
MDGHDMGGMTMSPPPMTGHNTSGTMAHQNMMVMHMTFFWGKNAQILFDGWPGNRAGMYALSLVIVFLLAAAVECLSRSQVIKPGTNGVAAGLLLTAMHTVRMGLAYLVMLAVMSFNGGVFLAAVGGHAVGFLVAWIGVFKKAASPYSYENTSDLPPTSC